MVSREFNFDPYINSMFREEFPDESLAEAGDEDEE